MVRVIGFNEAIHEQTNYRHGAEILQLSLREWKELVTSLGYFYTEHVCQGCGNFWVGYRMSETDKTIYPFWLLKEPLRRKGSPFARFLQFLRLKTPEFETPPMLPCVNVDGRCWWCQEALRSGKMREDATMGETFRLVHSGENMIKIKVALVEYNKNDIRLMYWLRKNTSGWYFNEVTERKVCYHRIFCGERLILKPETVKQLGLE